MTIDRQLMAKLDKQLAKAVKHFWRTRRRQDAAQGSSSGQRDYGNLTAATGGKQLDGFTDLIRDLLVETAVPSECIFTRGREDITLPGFFRPTKLWDVLVVVEGNLLAAIECKSLCGPSFGNNYNNRVEEALGSATDIWTAYREGVFDHSPEPFIGYLLMLEDHDKSVRSVRVNEKHFAVFPEFRDASYAQRCEHTLRRLVRERCYNAAALVVSSKRDGALGKYREPADDLRFAKFAQKMCGQVSFNLNSLR